MSDVENEENLIQLGDQEESDVEDEYLDANLRIDVEFSSNDDASTDELFLSPRLQRIPSVPDIWRRILGLPIESDESNSDEEESDESEVEEEEIYENFSDSENADFRNILDLESEGREE